MDVTGQASAQSADGSDGSAIATTLTTLTQHVMRVRTITWIHQEKSHWMKKGWKRIKGDSFVNWMSPKLHRTYVLFIFYSLYLIFKYMSFTRKVSFYAKNDLKGQVCN